MKSRTLFANAALLTFVGSGLLNAQQCDTGIVFSGPIVITSGGVYSGNWQSTDPSVDAVAIKTAEPVTIINSRVKGPGNLIHYGLNTTGGPSAPISASSLTVQQSCFVGTNPNVAGQYKGSAVWAQNAARVLVESCDFESAGKVNIFVEGYVGNNTLNNSITILNNRISNVDGRPSDGNGGYLTTNRYLAHAIQLADVHGVPGIEIAWNQIINQPYESAVDDSINMYDSSGTPAIPLLLHDNYIQGGYEPDPTTANEYNYGGEGIQMDGSYQTDPSLVTSFVKIYNNQTVSESRGGLSASVGHDIEFYSNRVVSSGQLADGTNYSLANGSGFSHQDYQNDPPPAFGNNSFHDNLAGMRLLQNGNWQRRDYYWSVPPAVDLNDLSWTPATGAAPTPTDEANELLLWNEKLIANGITVGSSLVTPTLSGSVQMVSGNSQAGAPSSTLAAPLVARVVNSSGTPAAGVNVSFMVASGNATASQHFGITDTNGLVSTGVVLGTSGAVQVNVIAVGYSRTTFNATINSGSAGNPAPQSILFGTLSNVTFGVAPFPLSATASSGLAVTFASTTPSVCTVSAGMVLVSAGGTCSIAASQAGNASYAPAPVVTESFTVTPASQTIAFATLGSVTPGTAPFTISTTASSGLLVTLSQTTGAVCAVSGNMVTIVGPGTCVITASQTGNASYAAATTVILSFPVSASAAGPPPTILSQAIVPINSTVNAIQTGEWVSIFGSNLATSSVTWNGNFPTSLAGTSVTIDGRAAYLWYVGPGQINLQVPNDPMIGAVPLVITTPNGSTSTTVDLIPVSPSFNLLDSKHVAGIILRSGSGAYGGGAYDILGPTGNSLGYPTVAAKAGDFVELFGVGFGPTNPVVPPGQAFSGAAATTNSVVLLINNTNVTPSFAGLSGAGLYQINLTVPPGLGTGDVPLVATVGGTHTPSGFLISLQ